jgi:predicted TIM-barrel fold metal-dependent hydrolase
MASTIPPIISVDDHLIEPPGIWQDRVPGRFKDRAPRLETHPSDAFIRSNGRFVPNTRPVGAPAAWWHYEDKVYPVFRYIASAGYPPTPEDSIPITLDDMRTGCWQQKARLEDMSINGIEASLCFPNYPRFCGQIFYEAQDRELAMLCVKAYNDFIVEEWCAGSGGRLVPLCLIPLWDVEAAASEVRRNAARGVTAVAFSELPAWLDLPSIWSGYWDPFFQACDETKTVIAMHIGSGTQTLLTSDDAPQVVSTVMIFANSAASMVDYLHSGVLARFPNLKLLYAECQIGWIPFILERADDAWKTHLWAHQDTLRGELPSSYYKGRIYSCFFKDRVGIDMLDKIGIDQVLFEADYPHMDGTWPHTKKVAADLFGHLDQSAINKIARENAIDLLRIKLDVSARP